MNPVRPILFLLALSLASIATAGDLDPPAGPVDSTMKTLDQVEPRTPIGPDTTPGDASATHIINLSGSYYLTGNLAGEPGKHGIQVNADDVTIDLMGYAVIGPPTGSNENGIYVNSADRISIRNGSIRRWGQYGIRANAASQVMINTIHATNNDKHGIYTGQNAIIRDCTASENANDGIYAGPNSVIERCVSNDNIWHGIRGNGALIKNCSTKSNGSAGIFANDNSIVEACQVQQTSSTPVVGIWLDGFSTARGCSVSGASYGIYAFNGRCLIESNLCQFSSQSGIYSSTSSRIVGNICRSNDLHGIEAVASSIENNTASDNDTDGINTTGGCSIIRNTCNSNGSRGIVATESTIENNSIHGNTFSGISVTASCRIADNNCDSNGTNGIYITGQENHVEGNRVANNNIGFNITDERNLVISNVARDNGTNYTIVADNRVGVLVVPPLSGVITGNTDPDALGAGTTDPWANFSY